MKITRTTVSFILVAVMILFMAQQAHALKGTATAEGTLLDDLADKDAAGTKLYGTVAIFNDDSGEVPQIYFIIRLSQGYRLYAFSGTASGVEYTDVDTQFEKVMDYIKAIAVPKIFPDADLKPDTDILFKSYDMLMEDNIFAFGPPCNPCAEFGFTILDVVVAVKQ
jgi:hypothetical protein